MDLFATILFLINHYLIRGLFVSATVIIFANVLFSKRVNIPLSIQIIKWVLISYSVLLLGYELCLVLSAYFGVDIYMITSRATGLYWFAYWLIIAGNCIFPFFLLIRKLGRNVYIILLTTFVVNIGWLFESFVIHTTNLHRDYVTIGSGYLPYAHEWFILLKGFVVGLLVVGIGVWRTKHYSTKV
jgi:hypothetical protein